MIPRASANGAPNQIQISQLKLQTELQREDIFNMTSHRGPHHLQTTTSRFYKYFAF